MIQVSIRSFGLSSFLHCWGEGCRTMWPTVALGSLCLNQFDRLEVPAASFLRMNLLYINFQYC